MPIPSIDLELSVIAKRLDRINDTLEQLVDVLEGIKDDK